jgi:hypothetical protein
MEKRHWTRGSWMTVKIIPLKTFMKKRSEQTVSETLSRFICSKDKGVQRYTQEVAVNHEESHVSRTHLIFDSEPTERLVAYITVAMKCLNLTNEQYDETLNKAINVNNGTAQSYLIGQLGKTDGYDKKVGDFAMDFALDIIQNANRLVGCRVVRLDCKDALVEYYKQKGFSLLSKNSKKDLNRMIMVLT